MIIVLFLFIIVFFCALLVFLPQLFPDIIKNNIEKKLDQIRNDKYNSINNRNSYTELQ